MRNATKAFFAALLLQFLNFGAYAVPMGVNTALVVNSASPSSMAVANAYIAARHIPPQNVIYIDLNAKYVETIDINEFRTLLLEPVFQAISSRKLNAQIDVITWSADFPHAVRVHADIGNQKLPKHITPVASINGLTYLHGAVLKKDLAYLALNSNRYAPPVHHVRPGDSIRFIPPRPFHRTLGWQPDGSALPNAPDQGYMLSTVLGITAGRGNSVDEVREMIRRSAAADGTAPKGTIYYMTNGDIRTKARQWGFKPAIEELARLGVGAQVADGALPREKEDVAGAMVGIADFKWDDAKSKILPGAIAEHLTSFGGMMQVNAGQTPISHFIRAGASGSSGTVTEPYAIQEKFPSPFLHAYYASGCSLAEAFYQSVSGPYQLLIIGDPLCRPWGKIPRISVNLQANAKLQGSVTLRPTCASDGMTVARYDVFLDGRWMAGEEAGKEIVLDTTARTDGWHELRVIGTLGDAIESKGETMVGVFFANQGREVTAKRTEQGIEASAPGASRLKMTVAGRETGAIEGSAGTFALEPGKVGTVPVRVQILADFDGEEVGAAPIRIE